MTLSLDPEIAAALAPMAGAMADATPPAVGDVAARRAMWEPIIGAASTAQPIPADVETSEHHTTADDGAQITRLGCPDDLPADFLLGRIHPGHRSDAGRGRTARAHPADR
jgi:hypothetical protein